MSTVIGGLAAGPFVIRHCLQKREALTPNDYAEQFRKYQALVDVPIKPLDSVSPISLTFQPPVGDRLEYLFFSPMFYPNEFSQATAGEPDTFQVQGGNLAVDRTPKGQVIIAGKDELYKAFQPTLMSELPKNPFTLLVQDGRLFAAKEKGTNQKNAHALNFSDLLSLQDMPEKPLAVGTRWSGKVGRVRPFRGFETNYEITGLSEIAGHKTLNVRFSSKIPNLFQLLGSADKKSEKEATAQNSHTGNVWFDLETGLLVRQEVEMTTTVTGVPELEKKKLVVNTKFVAQLFTI